MGDSEGPVSAGVRREGWQRARRPDEQADRRSQVTGAVRACIGLERPPLALTVAQIADAAGMSPATLYTYFSGKEAALLATLADDLTAWLVLVGRQVTELEAPASPEAVADVLVDSLVAREVMIVLLVALTELERAVDAEDLSAFKERIALPTAMVEAALAERLGGADGVAALRYFRGLVVGLFSFGYADDDDLGAAELAATLDTTTWFLRELRASTRALIRGMAATETPC